MKRLTIVLALLAVMILGGILWWKNGLSPTNLADKENKIFVIAKGSGLKEIANKLENEGLIRNRIVFFLYTRLGRFENKIQAGSFRLNPSMTSEEIAQNLTHGTLDVWITIPEGKRTSEIAETLKEEMYAYDSSWKSILVAHEGYLFPDTYLIPKDAEIDTILNQMLNNFDAKYATLNTSSSKMKKEEIVIIASLIEREAITDAEKPIIAGILVNRLNLGMALQVDATIQYAKGQNPSSKKWWEPVTFEEYKSVKSDYNTYLFPGLPPGPISNPGIESLRAAAFPSETDYLYYLHDKNGKIRYAKTFAEHNANIEKFGL
ncbi:MAG: endolytic transglycosylase MltG [Candidatus Parcubacteria bacterium]|nr:endolytic transglycosylase MltG [Candidatus Parcubacteria bacterium]